MSIKFRQTDYGALLTRTREPQYIAKLYRFSGDAPLNLYPYPSREFCPKLRVLKPCLCTVVDRLRKDSVSLDNDDDDESQWIQVIVNGHEGYLDDLDRLTPIDAYIRYEAWPGNNVFLCRGNVMMGPDFRFFIFTNTLLVFSMAIFSWRFQYFPLRAMPDHQQFTLMVVELSAILNFIYTSVNLWLCNLTGNAKLFIFSLQNGIEPGILPRNPPTLIAIDPQNGDKYCETWSSYADIFITT